MNTIKQNPNQRSRISDLHIVDGLLLAMIPVVGYFIMYIYEVGYIKRFDIPLELVSINYSGLLHVSIFIFIIVWGLYLLFELLYILFEENPLNNLLVRITFPIVLELIFFCILLLAYRGLWNGWKQYLSMIAVLNIIRFGSPFIMKEKEKTYSEKLVDIHENQYDVNSLTKSIVYTYGLRPFWIPFMMFMIFVTAYYLGDANSINQKSFLVWEEEPSIAVVRIYNDKAVVAQIDTENNTISKSFYVVDIKSNFERHYRMVEFGKLEIE